VDGWERAEGNATVKDVLPGTPSDRFADHRELHVALSEWLPRRSTWVTKEKPARAAMTLFSTLYKWYGTLEREGEKFEVIVADGLISVGSFNHPVLTQALELIFHPEGNQPVFELRLRENSPELYVEFLRILPEVNGEQLRKCIEEQKILECSPTGAEDTSAYLQRLVQGLFPQSGFYLGNVAATSPSTAAMPRPTIKRSPLIIMRVRRSGAGTVFQAILDDIAKRAEPFSTGLLEMAGLSDGNPASVTTSQTSGSADAREAAARPAAAVARSVMPMRTAVI
jgi:hypothetical protein